jgi:hypothetical protein
MGRPFGTFEAVTVSATGTPSVRPIHSTLKKGLSIRQFFLAF